MYIVCSSKIEAFIFNSVKGERKKECFINGIKYKNYILLNDIVYEKKWKNELNSEVSFI